MKWPTERVEVLRALLNARLTFEEIAFRMGITRSAVAGAKRRLILCVPDMRPDRQRRPRSTRPKVSRGWTESALTETWEDRKRRLQT